MQRLCNKNMLACKFIDFSDKIQNQYNYFMVIQEQKDELSLANKCFSLTTLGYGQSEMYDHKYVLYNFFDSYWKYAQFNLELLSISTQKFILMIEKYQMYFETPTQQNICRLLLVKKVSECEKHFFQGSITTIVLYLLDK